MKYITCPVHPGRIIDPSDAPENLRLIVVDKETDCWLWTGRMSPKGYGRVTLHGMEHNAHRALYEVLVEPVDHAIPIHHECSNRHCVNPAHLKPLPQHLHARLRRGVVLTPEQVNLIRSLRATTGLSASRIARQIGCKPTAVTEVVNGRSWRSLPRVEPETMQE